MFNMFVHEEAWKRFCQQLISGESVSDALCMTKATITSDIPPKLIDGAFVWRRIFNIMRDQGMMRSVGVKISYDPQYEVLTLVFNGYTEQQSWLIRKKATQYQVIQPSASRPSLVDMKTILYLYVQASHIAERIMTREP